MKRLRFSAKNILRAGLGPGGFEGELEFEIEGGSVTVAFESEKMLRIGEMAFSLAPMEGALVPSDPTKTDNTKRVARAFDVTSHTAIRSGEGVLVRFGFSQQANIYLHLSPEQARSLGNKLLTGAAPRTPS